MGKDLPQGRRHGDSPKKRREALHPINGGARAVASQEEIMKVRCKPSTRPSNRATVGKLYLDSHLGSFTCLDKKGKTRTRQNFPNLQETNGQDKPYGSIAMWENCTQF
jgi:hypothetical protein